jgi:hypothetical protein
VYEGGDVCGELGWLFSVGAVTHPRVDPQVGMRDRLHECVLHLPGGQCQSIMVAPDDQRRDPDPAQLIGDVELSEPRPGSADHPCRDLQGLRNLHIEEPGWRCSGVPANNLSVKPRTRSASTGSFRVVNTASSAAASGLPRIVPGVPTNTIPRQRPGWTMASSCATLCPRGVAADHRLLDPEVIEHRHEI